MKKSTLVFVIVLGLLLATILGLLVVNSASVSADGPPPPGGPPREPRPTPVPTAQLGINNGTSLISPIPLVLGQPMTYTVEIDNAKDSRLDALDAVFELPFQGDQQFVSFSTTNPNWKIRTPAVDPNKNTVFVDLGLVKPGDGGTITVKTIFATNYDKTIFLNTMYLSWNDEYAYRRKGTNVTAQVSLPTPSTPTPIPDPPRSQPPSPLPSSPIHPTSGPFVALPNPGTNNTDSQWYFPATGHYLRYGFLNYWRTHGATLVLGYPTSEEYSDNGRTIQYFERAVLEFWPENKAPYDVLLRSLGRELTQAQPPIAPGTAPPSDGSVFYAETGHWLDSRFVATWKNGGGLTQYGFPIQEPTQVGNKLIQWTERARFELDLSRPGQLVMLGLVGNESAQRKGLL